MKNKLIALALLIAPLAFLTPGCTTPATKENRAISNETIAVVAQISARRATMLILSDNPGHRPAFEAAVTVFDQLLLQPTVDYAAFAESVQKLKIDELHDADGKMLIADVLDIWNATLGHYLRVGEDSRLRPVAEAIRDGVKTGLFLTPEAPSE